MSDTPVTSLIDKAALRRQIERLDVSADIKLLLDNLLEVTHTAAGKVIQVGTKVLELVFDFAKANPGVAFGIGTALVIAYLTNSISWIGPVLAPILTPLLLILGIGLGALNDRLMDGSVTLNLGGMEAAILKLGAR